MIIRFRRRISGYAQVAYKDDTIEVANINEVERGYSKYGADVLKVRNRGLFELEPGTRVWREVRDKDGALLGLQGVMFLLTQGVLA